MSNGQTPQTLECAIVGGGIHGTILAQRLLEETPLEQSALAIFDPHDRLLESFRRKGRACGMDTLRSTFVHHVGTEAFGLERFAEAASREDEFVETVDYPPRPSLELFLDHATSVIDRTDLESVHLQASVGRITERKTGDLRLETTAGPVDARRCVLAIGHGDRYRWPEWARSLEHTAHVWDGFDPTAAVDRTIVVGSGITAVRLACSLSETQSVTLLTRRPLEWEVAEADPPWITWSHIEEQLHHLPPGSAARLEVVDAARHTATVPPYLYSELESQLESGRLAIEQGEIREATADDTSVELTLEHHARLDGDRIVLATGFEPPFDHPFVEGIVADLELEQGHAEMPVLEDETLAWRRIDGTASPLYVSGALALGTVGPYAPNIPGARRTGDRITRAISSAMAGDERPPVSHTSGRSS